MRPDDLRIFRAFSGYGVSFAFLRMITVEKGRAMPSLSARRRLVLRIPSGQLNVHRTDAGSLGALRYCRCRQASGSQRSEFRLYVPYSDRYAAESVGR